MGYNGERIFSTFFNSDIHMKVQRKMEAKSNGATIFSQMQFIFYTKTFIYQGVIFFEFIQFSHFFSKFHFPQYIERTILMYKEALLS